MNIEQILENIELHFLKLTNECKNELKEVSKILTIDKETKIVKEGQFADKTYFISTGSARAFYLKDGKDITDWFAFENDFISSINSFFLNIPSPHYIEVLEPTVLLEISRDKIIYLSDKYKEFDRLGKLIVTKTMLQLQQRVVSIQFEAAQQKYENILKLDPTLLKEFHLHILLHT